MSDDAAEQHLTAMQREGQIPYDLTYMWNLMNKIN